MVRVKKHRKKVTTGDYKVKSLNINTYILKNSHFL